MKVETVYRPDVITIAVGESLADAASLMQFNEVGALPVFDGDELVGIITERDLVRAMADGERADEVPVSAYMTSEPTSVAPETSVREAADRMLELGVRHLPVVESGKVIGMVSVRDLLVEVAL